MYDSFEDENYNQNHGRIIIFSTNENLRNLFKSQTWYVDGTFSVVPTLFFQLFAIMGSVSQGDNVVALPFVYALMENKEQVAYKKVMEILMLKAEHAGIQVRRPPRVMSDFELAIINAITEILGNVIILCLFHLCQSIYRRIQAEGLQTRYQDEDDDSIRQASKMMCALAFVPVEHVPDTFDLLMDHVPEDFVTVAEYFEVIIILMLLILALLLFNKYLNL